MDNKFEYTYSAPTAKERKYLEAIKREYLGDNIEPSVIDKIRALDKKIKNTATAVSLSLGIVGLLIFGGGLSLAILGTEPLELVFGVVIGLIGDAVIAVAYPIHKRLLKRGREKHADEMQALFAELDSEGKA